MWLFQAFEKVFVVVMMRVKDRSRAVRANCRRTGNEGEAVVYLRPFRKCQEKRSNEDRELLLPLFKEWIELSWHVLNAL